MRGQQSDEPVSAYPEGQLVPCSSAPGHPLASIYPPFSNHAEAQALQHRLDEARTQLTALLNRAVTQTPVGTGQSSSSDVREEATSNLAAQMLRAVREVCRVLLGAQSEVALILSNDAAAANQMTLASTPDTLSLRAQQMQHLAARFPWITLTARPNDDLDSGMRAQWASLESARKQLEALPGGTTSALLVIPVPVGGGLAALLLYPCSPSLNVEPFLPTLRLAQGVLGASLALEQQAAETRARNAAYDAFLSLTAHELRSPLTAVKGYAQLLARQSRKVQLPDLVLRSTDAIEQQATRMGAMIDELHDAARIRRGVLEVHLTDIDLFTSLREAAEQWQTEYPTHKLELDVAAEHLPLHSDPRRIRQALHALVDNAIRYSPGHATVCVRVWTDDSRCVIAVTDQGLGVAPNDRERIFDYLYRSPLTDSRNLSGLGLGLFVSRNLIERLGGHLDLYETTPVREIGSEFRITLPLTSTTA